mmetsp:Transcript_44201/g.71020  ORF Transcript_44201/g.71020 Transcript_44201/m.71020 type:complete len:99 (+) Transcript_44201:546-842(+)
MGHFVSPNGWDPLCGADTKIALVARRQLGYLSCGGHKHRWCCDPTVYLLLNPMVLSYSGRESRIEECPGYQFSYVSSGIGIYTPSGHCNPGYMYLNCS